MILDLSDVDMGHDFKIIGGPSDGEQGCSCDYLYFDGEEVIDDFTPLVAGHVRTDLAPVVTYMPKSIWARMEHH